MPRKALWVVITVALPLLLGSAPLSARELLVTGAADSGSGSLRWALEGARPGDVVRFDSKAFPAQAAATIHLQSELPPIRQGRITIDGSDAGVVIDGSEIPGDWCDGLRVFSDHNAIRGLQVVRFTGSGIAICSANYNTVGGDRSVGKGPVGQGNVVSGNGIGIDLCDRGIGNVIAGNLVGVSVDGKTPCGNSCRGIWVEKGVTGTQIGPDNVVAYNGCAGIEISGGEGAGARLWLNDVHGNAEEQIRLLHDASDDLPAARLAAGDVAIQFGNTFPLTRIVPKPSWELEDNRIGAHWHLLWEGAPDGLEAHEIASFPVFAAHLGMKRFRLSINSMDSSSVHWDKRELSIDALHDRFIDTLVSKGIAVTMVLSFWDTAHRAAGWPPIPRFANETDVQRYLEYVRFTVSHFRGRVECYELWNEPTIEGTIQWVKLSDYIALVRRAVPVIRQADPAARIAVGGTDYLRYEHSREFLQGLVSSDIMPLVDVVSFHPLYGTSPEFPEDRQFYYDYPAIVRGLQREAEAHRFRGEFRADELVWRTPATTFPGWPNPILSTERRAAKHYARGIVTNLGLGVAVSQLGVEEWYARGDSFRVVQNLATVMAGHSAAEIPVAIDADAGPVAHYGFELTNGDRLFAVWFDGVPIDEDGGIPCTIRFPALTAVKLVAVDVLNGVEQELVFRAAAGGIEVPSFSLKDYPVLIRITPASS